MTTKPAPTSTTGAPLVPNLVACKEVGICPMTASRYDEDDEMIALGWPPPIRIKRRIFRTRPGLDVFKNNLIEKAIAERSAVTRKQKRRAGQAA